jgi:hypothetical protein
MGEPFHPSELLDVTAFAPRRVIEVLAASCSVVSRRLDVPVLGRADPDLGPGRGDGERLDPSQRLGVADRSVPMVDVREPCAASDPADARL